VFFNDPHNLSNDRFLVHLASFQNGGWSHIVRRGGYESRDQPAESSATTNHSGQFGTFFFLAPCDSSLGVDHDEDVQGHCEQQSQANGRDGREVKHGDQDQKDQPLKDVACVHVAYTWKEEVQHCSHDQSPPLKSLQ
jgi:hypothetical protein